MNRANRAVVPDIKYSVSEDVAEVLRPLKEIADRLSGLRPGVPELELLGPTSSLNDVINKVNEVITRLQS